MKQPIFPVSPTYDSTLVGAWLAPDLAKGADGSTADNDMTASGTIKPLEIGSDFDGSSGYFRKAIANFRSTDSLGTIEAWVKRDSIGAYDTMFSSGDEGGTQKYFLFGITNTNRMLVGQKNGDTADDVVGSTSILNANEWYHLVLVSSGTAWSFYINGESEGTTVSSGANTGDWFADTADRDSITIGTLLRSSAANYFDGSIACVNIYSEAKTASWVSKRFKEAVPDARLLHVSGDIEDISRYRRTLTVSSKPSFGKFIGLDGVDDGIDCGDIGNIQAISFWCKPNSTSEELILVDTNKNIKAVSGVITYTGLTEVATYVDGEATTALVAGKWQHLVCVMTQVDANNFELGCDGGGNFGQTDMDEIKAFDSILTASWAKQEYLKYRSRY